MTRAVVRRVPLAADPLQEREPLLPVRQVVAVTLDDHFLCSACGRICHGVEAAAVHAAAEHPDVTELTMLNLDDPTALPPLSQPY